MSGGWDESAGAWVASLGKAGDYGRAHVLDQPMLARVRASGARTALDVGCGEGRFCRMMRAQGLATIGIDPTRALLAHARDRDPDGDYRHARAEELPFDDGSFDLVVSYLTLIDIEGLDDAFAEMSRVLAPGGRLLIANLQSFNTASDPALWQKLPGGAIRLLMDDYLSEMGRTVAWKGIEVVNYHRPLSRYMSLALNAGLHLTHFDEPPAVGGDPARAAAYAKVPWFLMMEWQKPG